MSEFVDKLKTLLHESIVEINFTKKDGSERRMKCTQKFDLIPAASHPKKDSSKKPNENILNVWDLEKEEWRSVRIDSINRWIDTTPPVIYDKENKIWIRD